MPRKNLSVNYIVRLVVLQTCTCSVLIGLAAETDEVVRRLAYLHQQTLLAARACYAKLLLALQPSPRPPHPLTPSPSTPTHTCVLVVHRAAGSALEDLSLHTQDGHPGSASVG